MAAGNGDAGGKGRWLASVPKLALVGVVASSRIICWTCAVGAVLGRGVRGFDSSAVRPWLSSTRAVLTGRKVVMVVVCLFGLRIDDGGGWERRSGSSWPSQVGSRD